MSKKLLIVSHSPYSVGGIETQLRWFYKECVDSELLKPTVLCVAKRTPDGCEWSSGKPLVEDVENARFFSFNGVDTIVVKTKARHPLEKARALRECLEKISNKYDILQLVSGTALLGICLAELKLPYFTWTATTLDSEESSKNAGEFSLKLAWKQLRYYFRKSHLQKAELSVLEHAIQNFVISQFTANSLAEEYPSLDKTTVIPIPIATPIEGREEETIVGRIIWAGRPSDSRKDLPTLFRAFKKVVEKAPNARLVLMGGQVPGNLKKMAKELGIDAFIDYLGRVDSPPSEFAKADIAVMSSLQEGQCLALLEAMALGVPPVSTKSGGPEGFIVEGENGLLVEKRDQEALSKAIVRLITDRALRDNLGKAAKQTVLNDFSPDFIFERVLSFYGLND